MAGDWLKMSVNLPDKPEVWQIAGMLAIDADSVVGKLLRVWAWFDAHTEDGNAVGVTPALLDAIAMRTGFADAMKTAGWLLETERGFSAPNFDAHNSKTAKARAETSVRVARHRAAKCEEGPDSPSVTIPRPIRAAVMERDSKTCRYCGRKHGEYTPPEVKSDGEMHIDHVVPVSRGGENTANNMVCACRSCNLYKGDRTPEEAGLEWPVDESGKRFGNKECVTKTVTREEKRREEENTLPGFVRFWDAWPKGPRKEAKGKCLEVWRRVGAEAQSDLIVAHIEHLKASPIWTKDGGQFVPAPLVYLNNRRWEGADAANDHDPYGIKGAI